jgi:hypothetical protein
MSITNGFVDSIKTFNKSGLIGTVSNFSSISKSKFGDTGNTGISETVDQTPQDTMYLLMSILSDDYSSGSYVDYSTNQYYMGYMIGIALQVVLFIAGWLAVGHISKGDSEKHRNIRNGLYIFLIISGGNVAMLYLLLSLFNIKLN